MFKNAERIGKTIETLMKVTEGLKSKERKAELVEVIHDLSRVHQNVLGDLRTENRNNKLTVDFPQK